MVFEGGGTKEGAPTVTIDGDGRRGPSPMLTLLLALAGCSGSDIVHVMGKMRVDLRRLTIDVEGTRRDEEPRRYTAIRLRYRLEGDGLDEPKAERAVRLSLEKYCSVAHSLAPDIEIHYEIEIA
ncbi:MAG: OsmC family protein [Gemmatimonadales bacterium]